ncbi:MAG: hypothetical protein GY941_28925, partial [Planctomycetes bacterium]|nr:hypothetical protein [Planctomycetota bacterium]
MVLPALAVKYPSGDAYREGQLGAQRVQSNALGMETQKLQNKGIERKHAVEGLRLVGGIAMGALNGDIDGQADPERWAQGMAELERMGLDTSSFKDNPQMASMLARNSLTTLQQVNMATNEAAVQESLRRFDIT